VADYQKGLAKTQFSLAYVSRRLGRTSEAADAYRSARDAWERLARGEPSNPTYRQELARCLESFAGLLESEGRTDEAVASHRGDLGIRRQLVQDYPNSAPYRDQLASSQFLFADLLAATGRADEARQEQREGLALREGLVRAEPNVDAYKTSLAAGYSETARMELDAGRTSEALRRLEQAGSIYDQLAAAKPRDFLDREHQNVFQLALGKALEASGDLAGALRAYERSRLLTEQMPVLYSYYHFHLARVHARVSALAARQGPSPGLGDAGAPDAHAAKAVDELQRALAAHYEVPSRIRTEPDLHSLRSRPDFQRLLLDLAFPSDPFAR
jgi:serine/threonine-protein kinase